MQCKRISPTTFIILWVLKLFVFLLISSLFKTKVKITYKEVPEYEPSNDFEILPAEVVSKRMKYLQEHLVGLMVDNGYTYRQGRDVFYNILRFNNQETWRKYLLLINTKMQSTKMLSMGEYNDYPMKTYKTCGVVSSEGNLLGSSLGKHIDKNDLVIRSNTAMVEGHEKDVGSGTNFQFLSKEYMEMILANEGLKMLNKSSNYIGYIECSTETEPEQCMVNDKVISYATTISYLNHGTNIHVIGPELYLRTIELFQNSAWEIQGSTPTTEFLSIMFALLHCETVYAYGFVPGEYQPKCHYYSTNDGKTCEFSNWVHPRHVQIALLIANSKQDYNMIFGHNVLKFNGLRSTIKNVKN